MTRRGTLWLAGALVAALAALLLLPVRGATSADAERCARLTLQSQVREHLVTGEGRRIVVIGDSYSVGLGLREPQTSWPGRLPGRVEVYGFSGSGFSEHASSCRGVSYADRAAHALQGGADLVVVEGGLNDTDQPVRDVRSGFRTLVRELRGHEVVVVGPPLAPARASGAARVDAVLSYEAARAGVAYVSMTGHAFGYLDDDLHLTPTGHRDFGAVVAAALPR